MIPFLVRKLDIIVLYLLFLNIRKLKHLKDKFGNTNREIMNYVNVKILDTDWDAVHKDDINTYSVNVTNCISNSTNDCLPHKTVNIRQSGPPWMHNDLRKAIRQRKHAYDKGNQTNNQQHWQKYKRLRNEATNKLRSSIREYFEKKGK